MTECNLENNILKLHSLPQTLFFGSTFFFVAKIVARIWHPHRVDLFGNIMLIFFFILPFNLHAGINLILNSPVLQTRRVAKPTHMECVVQALTACCDDVLYII